MHKDCTVVFGFDMETDIGSWTPFYEGLLKGTPKLLDVLFRNDIKSTFFFTGDAAKNYPEIVQMTDKVGHEIGCHSLYHETLGDEIIPIPGIRPVLPEECYNRVRIATDIVQQAAGKKINSFRAPRLWASTYLLNTLEELGYAADASYPLYYFQKRLTPYHPHKKDWTSPGDMKILEIPNFADLTIKSNDEFGRDRDQWPLYRTKGASSLLRHIDNMLSLYEKKKLPAVLCFYFHPWEFYKMPEGAIHYGEGAVIPDPFITKNCGEKALFELEQLIRGLKERKAKFLTAGQLAETYDSAK